MLIGWDVDKLEIKQQDSSDPSVDSVIWVESGTIDHSFHELRIHLYNQLLNSNSVKLSLLERMEESIELKLGLRVTGLAVIEGNGSCQGAVFMAAKFEVFPTLSLKNIHSFYFSLRTYQTNPLSLPPFPFILTNQTSTMGNNQLILDIFWSLLKTPY